MPEELWVTPTMVAESPIGKYVEDLELWLQVVLYLIYDRSIGDGKYKAYSELVVKKTSSVFFWPDEQVKYLEGTQVYERLKGYT